MNLSTQEMPDAMKAFLSLGAKFCPVDLDFDRKQMEQDLETWYKRLRVKANYPETEDTRTEEEKRFYLRTGWAPTAGKFASLDLFIHLLKKKAESWIPPVRIKDNMTAEERRGMEMVIKDKDNVYRMEDKGSSVVRMDKSHYVKNVTSNLEQSNLYEKVDEDNTEEIKKKV